MQSGIYLITNKINDKVYVGQAKNFKKRWLKKYNKYLENAFKKYGKENFYFHILEEVEIDKALLNLREQWWLDFFESYNPEKGYNILKIADSSLGYKHSEEALGKMRGRKLTPEQIKRLSETRKNNPSKFWQGKHRSKETKEKISKARKEKFANGEYVLHNKGKKMSEEFCRKISEQKKEYYKTHRGTMHNKKHTEETKKRISNSKIGKKLGTNKLSKEQLFEIKEILAKDFHLSYKDLAKIYNVSVSLVDRVVFEMKKNGIKIGKKKMKRNNDNII